MLLGIDLGTTYSAVSYLDKSGNPQIILNREEEPMTPSVVFVDGDTVLVGQNARKRALHFPEKICKCIKRLMGFKEIALEESDTQYTPEAISGIIIKRLLEDVLVQFEEEITGIVVTVPTYFDDTKRTATKQAVEGAVEALKADKNWADYVANVDFIGIIDEPKAAALYYSHKAERKNGKILIYDLGGGTFDAALIEIAGDNVTVIAEGEEHEAGGAFFDEKICDYVMDEVLAKYYINLRDDEYSTERAKILLDAEVCKKQLSMEDVEEVNMAVSMKHKTADVLLTRDTFNDLIENMVHRTIYVLEDILEEKDLNPDEVDEIVLVGGSSRIPYVRERLKELFGKELSEAVDPDKAVSYGAALYAGMLHKQVAKDETKESVNVSLKLQDVCAHSIGMLITDPTTKEKINDILIEENTPIVAESERPYAIANESQTYIKIELTESGSKFSEQLIKLPHGLPRNTPVKIHVRVNQDHLIEVAMTVPSIDFTKEYKVNRIRNLSEEEQMELSGLIASKTLG